MDRPQVLILGQDPNLVRPVWAALQNSLIVQLVHIHTEQASNPSCSIMRISKDSAVLVSGIHIELLRCTGLAGIICI
jgi:hypothetical protein